MRTQDAMIAEIEGLEREVVSIGQRRERLEDLFAKATHDFHEQGGTLGALENWRNAISLDRFYVALSQRLRAVGMAPVLDATPASPPTPGSTEEWVAWWGAEIRRLVP